MSKLLISENPMMVIPSLATKIGVDEAIVLQQIHYWLVTHQDSNNERSLIDGRWWVYNTIQEWQENQFRWWSVATVKRHILFLEKAGLVESKKFQNKSWNQKKWYTINYAAVELLESVPDGTCFLKSDDRSKYISKHLKSASNPHGYALGQIDPIDQVNLDSTNGSICANDLYSKDYSLETISNINGHKAFSGGKTPRVRSHSFDPDKAAPREEQQPGAVERRQPDSSVGLKGAGSRPSPSSAAPLPLRSRKMRRDHNGIVHLPQTGKEKLAAVLTIRSVQIWLACEHLGFEIGVDPDGRYYGCDPEWNEWTPEDEIFGTYAPLTKLSSMVLCKDDATVTADEINEEIFFWFDFWRSQLADIKIGRNQRVNVARTVSQRYELAIASVEWEEDDEF